MRKQELLRRISRAIKGKKSKLTLAGQNLRFLPMEIDQLTDLQFLNLDHNRLTTLPQEIGHLKMLSIVSLCGNNLEVLPSEIGQLSNLIQLDLRHNALEALPSEIGQLINLGKLDLQYNHLNIIPSEIGRLLNLTQLNLPHNALESLPSEIGQLTNLGILDLQHNNLDTLPSEIGRLSNLTQLNLRHNDLEALPSEIGQLTNLRILDLQHNNLDTLPSEIGRLSNLTQLELKGNPLSTLPPEIRVRGVKAIVNFYRQKLEQKTDHIYEAKFIIIGEGGAGKTTLAKKIQNSSYQLRNDEESTEGIDIIRWSFPLENGRNFQVNIWDFGGQEIYHTTHQFFLTKRSLYALVADTRKEDTDFYYWLNIVELLSANSPLIVIKNEKQDRQKEINERQLRGEFTNFKETISANFATNRGLPKILSSIQHYISDLPLVGTELPITWIKVREELEKSKYNYINVKDYLDICQDNGFTSLEDKLQLSSYLHDLGVFLHFQNDDLLYKTVILKPTWGTDAVYKVLDNSSIIQNQGRFNRKDLAKIWHEEKYNLMRAELLRLMMNFKLCYEIPSSPGNYIAPQLLSPNRPEYPWDETNNLFLRYEYEFMPKGILTRFIVEMHPWIEKQLLVWKSGIILNKDQARAEVIEHYRYHKGEIQIRVAGKRKKNLLITAMYEFSKIHRSYERLRFNTLVPCNCDFCKSHQFPHFYALKVLYKFLDDKQEQIQCQASYQMINVRNLIDDAVPEPGHVEERNREEVSSRYQNWKSNTTINIYNKNIQEDNKMSNFNISGGNQGAVGDNASASNFLQSSSQQNQTLSEAAQEIKRLLDQLDTSATESEKAAYINDETSPGFKRRVVGALKAAGETAVEEFFIDNPYLNVVKSGIKSWISSGR